ncbi:enolase [Enterococcus faecium]|nr:enolase [Enterococcus faecium]
MVIKDCWCIYILDSKGFNTVEVGITLENGVTTHGAAPRGSTTGHFDVKYFEQMREESRFSPILDGNQEYFDLVIKPFLLDRNIEDIKIIEGLIDGLPDIDHYGNLKVALSYAIWKALSSLKKIPMWKLFNPEKANVGKVKYLVNIFDGHSESHLKGIEFLLLSKKNISYETLNEISMIKENLKMLWHKKGFITTISNQGAVSVKTDNFNLIVEVIRKAVFDTVGDSDNYSYGLDLAMTDCYDEEQQLYFAPWTKGQAIKTEHLIRTYVDWIERYHITYFEDLFSDVDYESWKKFKKLKIPNVRIFGDDFFATNLSRLRELYRYADGIVIKPNQIGSISDTLETISFAIDKKIQLAFSQRTSETDDLIISHLAMSNENAYLKAGGLERLDRVEKYNEVLRYD